MLGEKVEKSTRRAVGINEAAYLAGVGVWEGETASILFPFKPFSSYFSKLPFILKSFILIYIILCDCLNLLC